MTEEERNLVYRLIDRIIESDGELTLNEAEQDTVKEALQNMIYEDSHIRKLVREEVKAAIKEINLERWEFEHEFWKQVAEGMKSEGAV